MTGYADQLICHAKRLVALPRPTEADQRQAVSAAYYALFHGIMAELSAAILGPIADNREAYTWTYRSQDHKDIKNRLKDQKLKKLISKLDPDGSKKLWDSVEKLVAAFSDLQDARHNADYAPMGDVSATGLDSTACVERAEDTLNSLKELDENVKRALSAVVLIKLRSMPT